MKRLCSFALVPVIILGLAALDVKLIARALLNPKRVEVMLAQILGKDFRVQRTHLGFDGLEVKGLRVPSYLGAPEGHLLRVDRIFVAFNYWGLATGKILPTGITLDNPRISLLRTESGEWEIAQLFKNLSTGAVSKPSPDEPASWPPTLTIHNAALSICDSNFFAPGHTQFFRDVDLRVIPFTQTRSLVEGKANAGALGVWAVRGEIDTQTPSFELTIQAPRLALDPALAATLNENIRSSWDNFLPNGLVGLTLKVTYNTDPRQPGNVDFAAVVDLGAGADPTAIGPGATAGAAAIPGAAGNGGAGAVPAVAQAAGPAGAALPPGVDFKYVNFPYRTRATTGQVEIRANGARMIGIQTHTLPSTVLRLDGWTDGFERDAAVNLRIDVLDMALDETLKHALDPDAQKAWELFEPSGFVDGLARITRAHGFNIREVDDITILCKGIHLKFRNFPYAIEDCHGELQFLGKEIHIKHLTGRHGTAEVNVRGDIFDISGETGWDVTVDAIDLALTDEVRAALSPSLRDVWDQYRPSGLADVTWKTSRARGVAQPENHHVLLRCKDVAATYQEIPYPLEHITGEIEYQHPRVYLRNLQGERTSEQGKVAARIDGTVYLDVVASDAPFPPGDGANPRPGGPAAAGGVGGAANGGGERTGNGNGHESRAGWDLTVSATDLVLDGVLRKAVESRLEPTWRMFEPAGKIDLTWTSRRRPGGTGAGEQTCHVRAKGATVTYEEVPYPIHNLTGEIDYDGQTVVLRNLCGGIPPEAVWIDGQVELPADRPPHAVVTIRGSEVPLDSRPARAARGGSKAEPAVSAAGPGGREAGGRRVEPRLIDAVPEGLASLLASVTPTGSVDFTLKCERVYKDRPAGASSASPGAASEVAPVLPAGADPRYASEIHYSANVRFMDCSFDLGLKVNESFGNLVIQGNVYEDEHDSLGSATFSQMKIEGKRFSDVSSHFLFKDHWLHLHDISSSAYKGLLQGNLRVNSETFDFDGGFTLAGLDLRQFSRDTFISGKDVSGTLGGEIRVSGLGKHEDQLKAEGKMTINDGQLWDVPIFLNLMSSLNLQKRSPFQKGSVKFDAEGGEIRIKSLEFESESVTVKGKGSMDFDGNMDLLLDTGVSIAVVPEVKLLSWLVGTIRKELFAVEVKGPFRSPSVGARILPSLGGSGHPSKESAKPGEAPEAPPPRRGRGE
ncbi:MAG: hypothetical protein HYZ53_21745 [Planctomycetes bacterium]|nr:hypothetical protein [Planctomycetota bacterium]